jgi:GT2 family glycosyltransferase
MSSLVDEVETIKSKMNQNLQVFCIIVTYNGELFIKKCLKSLKESLPLNKIIIIDNRSIDNTVKIIESEYTAIQLIKLDRNYGFGKANNIGIKLATEQKADYVFLLNQDVYVETDTLCTLIELAEQYSEYAILSPMQLNGKGDCIDYHFSNCLPLQLISDTYLQRINKVYPCQFVNAACWLISKKCIEDVGGFDPIFFHYGEDDDYINRIKYYKMSVGICAQVKVNHDRGIYNALSTYTDFQKEYLEYLKGLKNINFSFLYVIRISFLSLLSEVIGGILYFNFKYMYTAIKIGFKILFQLNKIQNSRMESKHKSAFINKTNPYIKSSEEDVGVVAIPADLRIKKFLKFI